MSVVQISRIQIRRGASSDLPNPLNEGEFGLTLDTGELFLGTPNLPQSSGRIAYPFSNTQVLTEWSKNIEDILKYRYLYRNAASPNGWASPTNAFGSTIVRNLQERLDERVSVKSYGAMGDGNTDDTYAIRRAAIDVTNTSSPNYLRSLYFPAGIYVVFNFALIPPNSCWIGEGMDRSVILCPTNANCVAQTCDGLLTVDDLNDPTQINNHIEFNISGQLPTNISIMGITFKSIFESSFPRDIVRLWRSSSVFIANSSFEGAWTCGSKGDEIPYNATVDNVGLSIDGLGTANSCFDINLVDCKFDSNTYGIFITDNVHEVAISQSRFQNLFKGVALGDTIASSGFFTDSFPITGITVTNSGSSYTTNPAVAINTTGSGSGATASSSIGVVTIVSIANAGSSYSPGDILTVSGGAFTSAATLTVQTVNGGGGITSATITTSGTYTAAPTNPVSVSGGSGLGAQFNLSFGVVAITLLTGGSGYALNNTTVAITGGGGSNSQAIIAIAEGPTAVKIINSSFFHIQNEAFIVSNNYSSGVGNISAFNRYEQIGFGASNCSSGMGLVTPCITFSNGTLYNISLGDTFDRLGPVPVNPNQRRINHNVSDPNIIFDPQEPFILPGGFSFGPITFTPLVEITLLPNTLTPFPTGISFPVATANTIFIDYSLRQGTGSGVPYRIGRITIITDGVNASLTEEYNDLAPPNPPDTITFSVAVSGSNVILQYTNTSVTTAATMNWTSENWLT